MSSAPLFTVVIATFNRGAHILPTVRSVLRQTCQDFELLVVGDCCTDNTAEALRPYLSDRVRWINLAQRGGSQSFPNNEGIRQSRGRYIAYLGHDDIWSADHLDALAHICFSGPEVVDIGVSGIVQHPGPGDTHFRVTGLFDRPEEAAGQFFPPSGLAHRRDLTDRIGPWGDPRQLRAPVDVDLLERAEHAGLRFRSTGRVTVHKFTAAMRHLGYLVPNSSEQDALLQRSAEPGFNQFVAGLVDAAKRTGGYMTTPCGSYDDKPVGDSFARMSKTKGSASTVFEPLKSPAVVRPQWSFYARDWHPEPRGGFQWAWTNPTPKWLLPFRGSGRALALVTLAHVHAEPIAAIDVRSPRHRLLWISVPEQRGTLWHNSLCFEFALRPDEPTIVEFGLRPDQLSESIGEGLAIGPILVAPADGKTIDLAVAEKDQWLHDAIVAENEDQARLSRIARRGWHTISDAVRGLGRGGRG